MLNHYYLWAVFVIESSGYRILYGFCCNIRIGAIRIFHTPETAWSLAGPLERSPVRNGWTEMQTHVLVVHIRFMTRRNAERRSLGRKPARPHYSFLFHLRFVRFRFPLYSFSIAIANNIYSIETK